MNSRDASVRKMSAKIFEKFLLHYPLSEKRVEQHFFFLLRNIEFEEEQGRLSVLKLLHALVKKFPQQILDEYGELILIHLIARTVEDESRDCKQEANAAVESLLVHLSASKREAVIKSLFAKEAEGQEDLLL